MNWEVLPTFLGCFTFGNWLQVIVYNWCFGSFYVLVSCWLFAQWEVTNLSCVFLPNWVTRRQSPPPCHFRSTLALSLLAYPHTEMWTVWTAVPLVSEPLGFAAHCSREALTCWEHTEPSEPHWDPSSGLSEEAKSFSLLCAVHCVVLYLLNGVSLWIWKLLKICISRSLSGIVFNLLLAPGKLVLVWQAGTETKWLFP